MGIVSMIGVIMGFILIMTSSANPELSKRFLFRRRDPEIKMNASQLITSKGYPCENHEVQTTDGFILGVQRIPHGTRDSQAGNRPVVLLQHGLLASSTCWLENLANQSLGYILADAGYDVWLGNSRGNTYGKRHIHYQPNQRKFWAWSWDEMAKYDLPDTINYVLRVSGQSQLYYVGHSQGTEIAFAEFSRNYELGRKVKTFFALAPVMKVGHMDSPLILLFPFMSGLHAVLNFFGHNEFLPSNVIMHFLASIVCPVGSLTHHLCDNILFLFGGYNSKQMNSTRIPVYIGHNPAGTSIQNMMHYAQSFKSNKFQMYDFGSSSKNIQHHGQTLPPLYDVSQMETPVAMFYGSADSFADLTDVKAMLPKLKNVVLNKEIHDWMHLDFIWAMDAPTTCYRDILTIMAQREMAAVLNFFGHNEFLPSNVIMHFLASIVCPVGSLTHHLCDNILFLFGGYNSKQMNSTRIPVYIGHNPAGTSIQNMMHYAQSFKSNKFQMYDFGSSSKNIQHHGQTLPPLYDVSQMETPVAMFYGSADSFADLTDVKAMLPKLKNVVLNKEIHDWMHLDFIWAMDAPTTCYRDILTIMAQREMAANATHS